MRSGAMRDHDTLAARVARVADRLRERALVTGTFDAELARDLETLAEVAATLQTIATRVDQFVDEMVEWCHE
jgi:hypothetical protein